MVQYFILKVHSLLVHVSKPLVQGTPNLEVAEYIGSKKILQEVGSCYDAINLEFCVRVGSH